VTSGILKPQQALAKLNEVITRHPWIKVVGIAGPGDPLANNETLETLRLIRPQYPYLQMCLSTNGLLLPENIPLLKEVGVSHLTVTINAVAPKIGKEIYSFVQWRGQIHGGLSGAELLLRQQLAGVKEAVKEGITVKINSVLIPTINDHHLLEVAIKVQELGASTMNILPLIPQYNFSHLKPPTIEERRRVREICGTVITQMRHCRQCRADAVGKLGGSHMDLSIPSNKKNNIAPDKAIRKTKEGVPTFRIAVASSERSQIVDQHFGHAKSFLIYQTKGQAIELLGIRRVELPYCTGPECHDPADILSQIINLLKDCQFLICKRIGTVPAKVLRKAGIEPVEDYDYIDKAIKKILSPY
jgi:nitrogen fixation protein NifB